MRNPLRIALPPCAKILGKCPTDPYVRDTINEGQPRLLNMGKYVDTYQHYRFCTYSGCITLPRQLETIEVAAICNWPVDLRTEWHQYVKAGFGLQSECVSDFHDKGSGWVAFDDVVGSNKVLRVYSDTPEAAGATILLQFWNENRIPVRTEYPAASGIWIDGERVAISTTQTNSVNQCMANGLVAVQKPITNGTVFLYEYDTVLLTQRLIAIYEPDETIPNYRRYVIPFTAGSTESGCGSQVVDVIAKRRFIPAINDDDWLIIGNVGALKMACKAIQKEENNLIQEAMVYWGLARTILDQELAQFLGDGMQSVMQINDEISNAAVPSLL